jgi:hypothetical protein
MEVKIQICMLLLLFPSRIKCSGIKTGLSSVISFFIGIVVKVHKFCHGNLLIFPENFG